MPKHRSRKQCAVSLLLGSLLAVPSATLAEQASQPVAGQVTANQPAMEMSGQDRIFAAAAVADGQAEVALARVAVDQAHVPEVKEFARRMIADHSRINEELDSILGRLNIAVVAALPVEASAKLELLKGLSGIDFDREYMKAMAVNHDEAVALFGDESMAGRNELLQAFATETIPTLKSHLARAHELNRAVAEAADEATAILDPSRKEAVTDHAAIEPGVPIADRTAADVIGQPVLSETGDEIGVINEVVLDMTTGTVYAIVPVGGVFGITAKNAAIDWRNLRTARGEHLEEGFVLTSKAEAELEERPAFDSSDERFIKYPDDRELGELGRY